MLTRSNAMCLALVASLQRVIDLNELAVFSHAKYSQPCEH
jgi:hypothetical protein